MTIRATERGIVQIAFDDGSLPGICRASALTNAAATQLQEYLAGKRRSFDVPLDVRASAFQKAVWAEVASIPYGQTRTAAEIAQAIGKAGSHRSVGTAIRQNAVAPIIPTHRVLAPSATGRNARIMRAFQALEQRHAFR